MDRVVFLHNTLTSHAIYDGVLPLLPDVEAHALDFRAHGARAAENAAYTADDLLRDVQTYANTHGLKRFSVVGSSIGATVALMLARAWPDRIDKMILTGVNVHSATLGERFSDSFNAAVLGRTGPISAFVNGALSRLFAAGSQTHEDWASHLRTLPPKTIAAAMRCWRDRPDLSADLAAMTTSTLFIAGEQDVSAPPRLAEQAARKMQHATLVHLERAGHMAPVEQPERFAELITTFLRKPADLVTSS